MNWTTERVGTLKRLWGEGLSASQIAHQLGNVSRSAVIGKIYRLKLPKRERDSNRRMKRAKLNKPKMKGPALPDRNLKPKPSAVLVRPWQEPTDWSHDEQANAKPLLPAHRSHQETSRPLDSAAPLSRRLRLVELTDTTCRWPTDDPLTEAFSFCGNEIGRFGRYCTYHIRLAYQPKGERRRIR